VLGGTGESELAADLQQFIGVVAVPSIVRQRDGMPGCRAIAQTCGSSAGLQVQLRSIRPVRQLPEAALRQVKALPGPLPVRDAR
jgi:hypothetical protein